MVMINKILKEDYALSLGERITVYSGAVLGAIAPVFYTRYVGFGDAHGDLVRESGYWVGSVLASIPLSIAGGVVGLACGMCTVLPIKEQRDKKRLEEASIDLEGKIIGGK